MTTLTRKVSRATRKEYSVLYTRANRIVVTLAPGDVLEFRELRRRDKWSLNIDTAFKYAVRMKAFADGAAKWRAKQ